MKQLNIWQFMNVVFWPVALFLKIPAGLPRVAALVPFSVIFGVWMGLTMIPVLLVMISEVCARLHE